MNVLLLTSHSIAEYDDLRMLTDLGYDTFSIGAYTDPSSPSDDKRPALDAPYFADLAALCETQRQTYGDPGANIDWAKARLHPDIIDWADVIICHHFPERWLVPQWEQIRRKRVIWRTCGQSAPDGSLEAIMRHLHGLEIVRYSPKERSLPSFAGETALIRFGKYPDDYPVWRGDDAVVGNVTQHMAQRGDACGFRFWTEATQGLSVRPAGPGSEVLRGGIGSLMYDAMLDYLRDVRTYLYTGTQPASYTLGLMEAMFVGTPIVSIGAQSFGLPTLFEGAEITFDAQDDPDEARRSLALYLESPNDTVAGMQRYRANALFGMDTIGPQWTALLG